MSLTQETITMARSQHSRQRFFRLALVGYAWLFLAAIVVEVYFAGLMLWGQEVAHGLHEDTGWILVVAGALFLVLPSLARTGIPTVVAGIGLALSTFAQPFLVSVVDSALVAAIHPVNALLMLVLPIVLIRRSTSLLRQERGAAGPQSTDEASTHERGQSVPVGADRST